MVRNVRASAASDAKVVKASQVVARKPDAEAWALARILADGDVTLLEVSADGREVKVRNR